MKTIHDISPSAFAKLARIPSQLPDLPDRSAITSLRMVVYTQQAQIEALERAVDVLVEAVEQLAGGRKLINIPAALELKEPSCRDEPGEDDVEPDEEAIPRNVYWDHALGLFFGAGHDDAMDAEFTDRWIDRFDDFPMRFSQKK